ncbi:MAG: hypothetical protein AAGL23_13275 [Pseudomonadota bacterium]
MTVLVFAGVFAVDLAVVGLRAAVGLGFAAGFAAAFTAVFGAVLDDDLGAGFGDDLAAMTAPPA